MTTDRTTHQSLRQPSRRRWPVILTLAGALLGIAALFAIPALTASSSRAMSGGTLDGDAAMQAANSEPVVWGRIPSVAGLTYREAVIRLHAAGFDHVEAVREAEALDRVVETRPALGQTPDPSAVVTVVMMVRESDDSAPAS